jgi:hypothetical protein
MRHWAVFFGVMTLATFGMTAWGAEPLTTSAPSTAPTTAPAAQKYSNPAWKISFDIPEGMELYSPENPGPMGHLFASGTALVLVSKANREVSINLSVANGIKDSDLDDFLTQMQQTPNLPIPGYQRVSVLASKVGKNADKKAVEHIFFMQGNVPGKMRQVTFIHNGSGYTFTCGTPKELYDQSDSSFFQQFFQSLAFE